MKSDWLFCGVVRCRLAIKGRVCLGFVELSRQEEVSRKRSTALEESAKAHGLILDNLSITAKCMSLDTTRSEAKREGLLAVREAVAMLPLVYTTITAEVTSAGYLMDFKTGSVQPVMPSRTEQANANMWIVSAKRREGTPPGFHASRILAYRSTFGELGTAIRRSCHWRTLARSAFDVGEELLFMWMASECLSRTDKREGLSALVPKLMSGLGFPQGRYRRRLPEHVQRLFVDDDEINNWDTYLARLFRKMADARNSIAHSAYREMDMTEFFGPEDMRVVRRALEMLAPRLVGLALAGTQMGLKTVSELWDNYEAAYFRKNGSWWQALNDARGNVISILKNKHL